MKNVFKIVFFIAVILVIVFGKRWIDKKTFNYKEVVDNTVANYFISGDTTNLEELASLLDSYSSDEDYVYNIQSYTGNSVWTWFSYIDGKYKCDKENLNSCQIQLEEFQNLSDRLLNFYGNTSNKNGYTLMLTSSYNSMNDEVNKKINSLVKVVGSPSAKNPIDSEGIRKKRCSVAQDCTNCRDGVCTCSYISDSGKAITLRCNN